MTTLLRLEPGPASVPRARRWVAHAFDELGRHDLTASAALGVSELVTNAILHADPPITVSVRGTALHPRVEVRDSSSVPPRLNQGMADEDQLLHTVGRGIGILALHSVSWGADVSPDGKVVWFEPTDEPDLDAVPSGSVYDLSEVVGSLVSGAAAPEALVPVRLVGMPVRVFADFRVWYAEIRRELRILALSHSEDYPVATAVSQVSLQVEKERAHTVGIDALDRAIRDDLERVDLEYLCPTSTAATMARAAALLETVDDFAQDHHLLTNPCSPQQVDLRRWYLGEFVRQGAGEPPQPWSGSYTVESYTAAS